MNSLQARVAKLLNASRLVVLVLALLGVALHIDASAADPIAPKELWFALAAALLPALAALRLWWGEPLRLPPAKLGLALLAWALVVTAAHLQSPFPDATQGPWQAWLLTAVLFLGALDLMAVDGGQRWLLRGLSLAAAASGGWALAQRLGWDRSALALAQQAAFGGRVSAGLGNPNFAGGYFVLVLPVLIHQGWRAEGKAWRWLARAAAALALAGLLLSAAKSAVLGLGVALAVAGHCAFWSEALWATRKRVLALTGGAVAVAFVLLLALLPSPSRQRLLGGPSAWAESVRFRELTWSGTWELAKERPLLGWGPGSFSVAYPSHRLPEAMADQSQHSYEVARPEDWPLQLLAETGWLGLAAGLALLGLLLWPLRALSRAWQQDPDRGGLGLALLAGLLGSLACNLAGLDLLLPSTLLPFVLLLALGAALSAQRAPAVSLNPEGYARLLVTVGLAFMASVPLVQAQLHWQASRLLLQSEGLSRQGQQDQALPGYQLALQLDPALLEARYFLGCCLQDRAKPGDLEAAEAAFDALRRWAPDYVQVHSRLGRLYQAQGRIPESAQAYEAQLKLDPWDLGTVKALASLYAGIGRLAEAEAVLGEAALRWPEDGDIARNLVAVQKARLKLEKKSRRGA